MSVLDAISIVAGPPKVHNEYKMYFDEAMHYPKKNLTVDEIAIDLFESGLGQPVDVLKQKYRPETVNHHLWNMVLEKMQQMYNVMLKNDDLNTKLVFGGYTSVSIAGAPNNPCRILVWKKISIASKDLQVAAPSPKKKRKGANLNKCDCYSNESSRGQGYLGCKCMVDHGIIAKIIKSHQKTKSRGTEYEQIPTKCRNIKLKKVLKSLLKYNTCCCNSTADSTEAKVDT